MQAECGKKNLAYAARKFGLRENNGHCLGVNKSGFLVRLTGQERVKVDYSFALFDQTGRAVLGPIVKPID